MASTSHPPSFDTNADLSRTIPYWFLALVGLIYASGFVVVSTFLETYGLREVGTDFWKARYIHIGFLCSVFPAVPVLTAYLLFRVVVDRHRKEPRPYLPLRIFNVLAQYLTLEIAYYLFVMLS